MHLLDDMSDDEVHYCGGAKKSMMESAVEGIPELANIKEIDANHIATGGVAMPFSQYKDTLLSAATRRDQCLKPASMQAKHTIQAMTANFGS